MHWLPYSTPAIFFFLSAHSCAQFSHVTLAPMICASPKSRKPGSLPLPSAQQVTGEVIVQPALASEMIADEAASSGSGSRRRRWPYRRAMGWPHLVGARELARPSGLSFAPPAVPAKPVLVAAGCALCGPPGPADRSRRADVSCVIISENNTLCPAGLGTENRRLIRTSASGDDDDGRRSDDDGAVASHLNQARERCPLGLVVVLHRRGVPNAYCSQGARDPVEAF